MGYEEPCRNSIEPPVCDMLPVRRRARSLSTSADTGESWPSRAFRRCRSGRLLLGGSDRAPRADRRDPLVAKGAVRLRAVGLSVRGASTKAVTGPRRAAAMSAQTRRFAQSELDLSFGPCRAAVNRRLLGRTLLARRLVECTRGSSVSPMSRARLKPDRVSPTGR